MLTQYKVTACPIIATVFIGTFLSRQQIDSMYRYVICVYLINIRYHVTLQDSSVVFILLTKKLKLSACCSGQK